MSIEDESDESLATRAGWDNAAMAELYRRYRPPIERHCRMKISDPDRALDVVSIVFQKAFEALRKVPASKPILNFRSWLYTISRNEINNSYRQYGREVHMDETFDRADNRPNPEDIVIEGITYAYFHEVMKKILTPDEYTVFELRWLGMTNPEIEIELGRTYSWVGSTYHRAIKKLKKYFDDLKQKGEEP